MAAPYTTSVYPYPAAMWDEAYEYLQTHRGWTTVLIASPPTTDEAVATARQEMSNRGLSGSHVIVFPDMFADVHCIRISRLMYIDPQWDEVEHHLRNHAPVAFVVIDSITTDTTAAMEEVRAAMAERGLNVGVGLAADAVSKSGLMRVELG